MRATPLFPLLVLILGHLLLPTFASPFSQDASPMEVNQHKRLIAWWAEKDAPVPVWKQTLSPMPPSATPPATPTVPLNDTTPGDDSGSNVQPTPDLKGEASLSSVNSGVALASRETLFFMVLAGVIATSLMF
ncbi:hypothetical protein EI94DRAFT_1171591 [Lactarius quietus]|nr:hypothetical protein EI94DRAFT_1171591 [Lactarius quietus]